MSDITTDFIKATNKIYAKVAAILTNLQIIEGEVKLIREQGVGETDKQSSANHQNDTKDTHANRATGRGKIPNMNPANRQDDDAEQSTGSYFGDLLRTFKKGTRSAKFFLELAALLVVITYTCETKRTNDLTDKSMKFQFSVARFQQRSYLQVDYDALYKLKLEDMKAVTVEFQLRNLGKVTASKIKSDVVMELPISSQPPSYQLFVRHSSGTIAPLVPGGNTGLPAMVESPTFEPELMTDEIKYDLREGKKYIVIFGRIEYEDAFGSWWQNFCAWRPLNTKFALFNASSCIEYNTEGGTPKAFPVD